MTTGARKSTGEKCRPEWLVDPDQRPEADVVIYDGQCAFCRGQVERLARWDPAGRLSFCSLHDSRIEARYPDLTRDMLMRQMYVVTPGGQRYGGAAAVRYLSRRLPRLWWLAPLLHLPLSLPWWQCCYRFVARQRYRLGTRAECDGGTCAAHRE